MGNGERTARERMLGRPATTAQTARRGLIASGDSMRTIDARPARLATRRRSARRFACLVFALLPLGAIAQSSPDPPTIAVLDFDLLDDQRDTVPDRTLGPRMESIRTQLASALQREGLYTVVDNTPARTLIDRSRAVQDLHGCNGCERTIAEALGARRVLVGWVQKVSNLILNINVRIEDVASGDVLLSKSVDLRGNTDETWRRGIDYLVRDMVEKHQGSR